MSLQGFGKVAVCVIGGIAVIIMIVILATQPISSTPETGTTPSNEQDVDLQPCAGPGLCHPRFNPY